MSIGGSFRWPMCTWTSGHQECRIDLCPSLSFFFLQNSPRSMKKEKQERKKAEWKTLFIDSQTPDLSLHFNPKRKKERNCKTSSFSLSLRLHFEVHKRIWLQHICAEAVLHCSSLVLLHFWSRATLCVGVYYPRLFDNSLYKNVEHLSKDLAGLSHACQQVTWLSAARNSVKEEEMKLVRCACGWLWASLTVSPVLKNFPSCHLLHTMISILLWKTRSRGIRV